jgi:hypothetical protein
VPRVTRQKELAMRRHKLALLAALGIVVGSVTATEPVLASGCSSFSSFCFPCTTTIDGCSGYRCYSRCWDGQRQYGCYDVGVSPDAPPNAVGKRPPFNFFRRHFRIGSDYGY